MTSPSNDFDVYLPVYNAIPEGWEDARAFLVERLREVTDGINSRDFAYYIDTETLNGQLWVPGTGDFRDVFRKVIDVGPLNNFNTDPLQQVPHGITTSANTCITRFYGAASDPGASSLTSGIPLPYVEMPTNTNHIGIDIDGTNINLRGSGDYSAYTCAYVVVEWIDEA